MADDAPTIPITADADIVTARGRGRALAGRLGFSRTDATLIATAISEIARNIVVHAGRGEIVLRSAREEHRQLYPAVGLWLGHGGDDPSAREAAQFPLR